MNALSNKSGISLQEIRVPLSSYSTNKHKNSISLKVKLTSLGLMALVLLFIVFYILNSKPATKTNAIIKSTASVIASPVAQISKSIVPQATPVRPVPELPLQPSASEFSAFIAAADIGDIGGLKKYIDAGFDVNKYNANDRELSFLKMTGHTAISHAANRGKVEALKFLVKAGATTNGEAIGSAAASKNPEALKFLLSFGAKYSVNDLTIAAAFAASEGRTENLRLLLDNGANLNQIPTSINIDTLLINAINGGHADCVKLLLKRGANPNVRQAITNLTPLFVAVTGSKLSIVKMLVEAGASLTMENGKNQHGNAYQAAIAQGEYRIANYLKSKGNGIHASVNGDTRGADGNVSANKSPSKFGGIAYVQTSIEGGAIFTEDMNGNTELIESLVAKVRQASYKCHSVAGGRRMVFSRGYVLLCDRGHYEYEVEDKGGNWKVTLK